jgi:hypothetical protein
VSAGTTNFIAFDPAWLAERNRKIGELQARLRAAIAESDLPISLKANVVYAMSLALTQEAVGGNGSVMVGPLGQVEGRP